MSRLVLLHGLAAALVALRWTEARSADDRATSQRPASSAWSGRAALGVLAVWLGVLLTSGPLVMETHAALVVLAGLTFPGPAGGLAFVARRRGVTPPGWWTAIPRAAGFASVPLVLTVAAVAPRTAAWFDHVCLPRIHGVALLPVPWTAIAVAGTVWTVLRGSAEVRTRLAPLESGLAVLRIERRVPWAWAVRPGRIERRLADRIVLERTIRTAALCDARRLATACAIARRARVALDDEADLERRREGQISRGVAAADFDDTVRAAREEARDRLQAAEEAEGRAVGTFAAALDLSRTSPSPDDGVVLAWMTAAALSARLLGASGADVSVTDLERALSDPAVAAGPAARVAAAARVLLAAHAVPAAWSPRTGWDPAVCSAIGDGGPAAAPLIRAAALVAEFTSGDPWAALGAIPGVPGEAEPWDAVPALAGSESRLHEADARRARALASITGRPGWDLVRAAARRSSVRAGRSAWIACEAAGDPVACNAFNSDRRRGRSRRGLAPVPPAQLDPEERAGIAGAALLAARRGAAPGVVAGLCAGAVAFGAAVAGWIVLPGAGDFVVPDDLRAGPSPAPFGAVSAVTWDPDAARWLLGGLDGTVASFDPSRRVILDPGVAPPLGAHVGPVRGIARAGGRTWVVRDGSLVAYGPGAGDATVVTGRPLREVADRAPILAATERDGRWLILFGGVESEAAPRNRPHLAAYDPSCRDWLWSVPLDGDPAGGAAVASTVGAVHAVCGSRFHVLADEGDLRPAVIRTHDVPPGTRIADVSTGGRAALCGPGGRAWVADPAGDLRTFSGGGIRPRIPAGFSVVPSDGWWWIVSGAEGEVVPAAAYDPATRTFGTSPPGVVPRTCSLPPAVSATAAAFAAHELVAVIRRGQDGPAPEPLSTLRLVAPVTSLAWEGADLRIRCRDGRDVVVRDAANRSSPAREDRGGGPVPSSSGVVEAVALDCGRVILRDARGALFVYDERKGIWLPAAQSGLPANGVRSVGGGGATAWIVTESAGVLETDGLAARALGGSDAAGFGSDWTAAGTPDGLVVRGADGAVRRYDAATAAWPVVAETPAITQALAGAGESRRGPAGERLVTSDGRVSLERADGTRTDLGEGRAAWIRNDDGIFGATVRDGRAWVPATSGRPRTVPAKAPWDEVIPLGAGWFADAANRPSRVIPPESHEPFTLGAAGFTADRIERMLRDGQDVLVRSADGWFRAPSPNAPLALRRREPIPPAEDRLQSVDAAGVPVALAPGAADAPLARSARMDWRRSRAGVVVSPRHGGAPRRLGPAGFEGDVSATVIVSRGRVFRIDDCGIAAEDGGEIPGGWHGGLRLVRNGSSEHPALLSAGPAADAVPDAAGGSFRFRAAETIRGTAVPEEAGESAAGLPFAPASGGGFLRDHVEDAAARGSAIVWRTQAGLEPDQGAQAGRASLPAGDPFEARARRRAVPVAGLGWTLATERGRLGFVSGGRGAPARVREFVRGRFTDDDVVSIGVAEGGFVVRTFHAPLVPLAPGADPVDGARPAGTAVVWPASVSADGSIVPFRQAWGLRVADGVARFRWKEGP